jgi:hypothetical protein
MDFGKVAPCSGEEPTIPAKVDPSESDMLRRN